MNGSQGDYYTTKGSGSQEVYDAYYEDYGNSAVWAHLNTTAQSNIANRGTGVYTTTHDAILETGIQRLDAKKDNNILLLLVGSFLAYNFLS